MARDSVFDVWNEIRVTDTGISVTLYSEGEDGAVVESESHFTFDELRDMAGAIERLNVSDETAAVFGESDDGYDLPDHGDVLVDTMAPHWAESNRVRVAWVYPNARADKWEIELPDESRGPPKTVADVNASLDSTQPVVEATYIDDTNDKVYAFPVERLRPADE